jgi:hypothetical protein
MTDVFHIEFCNGVAFDNGLCFEKLKYAQLALRLNTLLFNDIVCAALRARSLLLMMRCLDEFSQQPG